MEEDLMMQFEVEFARVVRLYYSRMQAQLAEVGLCLLYTSRCV